MTKGCSSLNKHSSTWSHNNTQEWNEMRFGFPKRKTKPYFRRGSELSNYLWSQKDYQNNGNNAQISHSCLQRSPITYLLSSSQRKQRNITYLWKIYCENAVQKSRFTGDCPVFLVISVAVAFTKQSSFIRYPLYFANTFNWFRSSFSSFPIPFKSSYNNANLL